jgi:hypothetical protein
VDTKDKTFTSIEFPRKKKKQACTVPDVTVDIACLKHVDAPQFPSAATYVVVPAANTILTLFSARSVLTDMVIVPLGTEPSWGLPTTYKPEVL